MGKGRQIAALLVVLLAGQLAYAVIPFPRINPSDPSSKPYRITSAYGPRMISASGYDFHEAMDFAGPPNMYDPVYALEGGTISAVALTDQPPGIVHVDVDGGHVFRYLHLFPEPGTSDFRNGLRDDVNATVSITGQGKVEFRLTRRTARERIAIVRFTQGISSTTAEYVIHPGVEGEGIKVFLDDGATILSASGGPAISTNLIADRMVLGPVGNSGGYPTHLHVDTGLVWTYSLTGCCG